MNPSPAISPVLLLFAGPSGVGKSTLVKLLSIALGYEKIVTVTERPPRPNEVHGVDYFFVSDTEFQKRINSGAFIEWAWVHGKRYGTLKQSIFDAVTQNRRVILILDVQGHRSLRELEDERVDYALLSVFLHAQLETLVRRALSRPGAMSNEELGRRVRSTLEELECATKDPFDLVFDNSDEKLEKNVLEIKHWVLRRIKERDNNR